MKYFTYVMTLLLIIAFTGCNSNESMTKQNIKKDENNAIQSDASIQKSEYKIVYNGNTLERLGILQDKSNELYANCNDFLSILDCKSVWDKENKSVKFNLNHKEFILKADQKYATIDGKQVQMESKNILYGNQIITPLKFLAESTGIKYQKVDKDKIIKLSSEQTIKLENGSNLKEEIVPINKEIKLKN